jgi:GTP-binding protein Era
MLRAAMPKPGRLTAKQQIRGNAPDRARKGPPARGPKQPDTKRTDTKRTDTKRTDAKRTDAKRTGARRDGRAPDKREEPKASAKHREPRQPSPPLTLPQRKARDTGEPSGPPRSGRCAILGRPNVGKSTLLNAMVGQKLAIAASKPQTTRTTLLGVAMRKEPPLQVAFIDTPGLHRPASALGRALLEAAEGELEHCDVVLLLVSVSKGAELSDVIGESERELFAKLKSIGSKRDKDGVAHAPPPVVLAINKVDQLKQKHLMLPLLEKLPKVYPFAAIVPISALKGVNVEELVLDIGSRLPEGLAYDEELLTDKPEKFFAAELVRESLIRNTRQEIPYAAAVVIDRFEDDVKIARITATVVVEKESHKGIVIGKAGQMLKLIGSEARLEMEQMFGRKVFLELWVKVVEDWTDNARSVRELLEADVGAAPLAAASRAAAATTRNTER